MLSSRYSPEYWSVAPIMESMSEPSRPDNVVTMSSGHCGGLLTPMADSLPQRSTTTKYARPTTVPPRALDSVPATDTPPLVPDTKLHKISNGIYSRMCMISDI